MFPSVNQVIEFKTVIRDFSKIFHPVDSRCLNSAFVLFKNVSIKQMQTCCPSCMKSKIMSSTVPMSHHVNCCLRPKLVEKLWAALLAWQHFQPQLQVVEVYQPQIVSEGESPESPSDSADSAQRSEMMHRRYSWARTFECGTPH